MTDTDRLNFLLQFISVSDVGDDTYCPGICVDYEEMEEKLTWGNENEKGQRPSLALAWNADIRDVIDRAICVAQWEGER